MEKLFNWIENYDSIIIARHKHPDLDAYGSQFGLYHALKQKYPHKNIYVVGDSNNINFFGELDEVSIEVRKQSLVLILDTVASQLLDPLDYQNYDKLVLIDHHRNDPDIPYDLYIKDVHASSSAELVAGILIEKGIPLNPESARAFYMGIIGDTGRFRFDSTSAKTFEVASKLMTYGIDLQAIHNLIYLDELKDRKIKSIFFESVEMTDMHVAYRKNTKEFLEKYDLDSHFVSRGLVGQMSGIKEIPVWVNFTYDTDNGEIKCEIRSRELPVLSVAKKYGGGGHLKACGCSVKTWEETDMVLSDLDEIVRESKK